eukprot:TsM_000423600 transcript=TsM_000423600 gene=TsM_000423600
MRLQDLKFLKKKPPVNPENARILINRVQNFLQTAESSEAPEGFENPEGTQQYIELNLFIPKGGDESNPSLLLPTDTASESGSSSSSSSSSGSSTTSSPDASNAEETPTNKRLLDSEEPRPSKRSKIEEIGRISDADGKKDTTS